MSAAHSDNFVGIIIIIIIIIIIVVVVVVVVVVALNANGNNFNCCSVYYHLLLSVRSFITQYVIMFHFIH